MFKIGNKVLNENKLSLEKLQEYGRETRYALEVIAEHEGMYCIEDKGFWEINELSQEQLERLYKEEPQAFDVITKDVLECQIKHIEKQVKELNATKRELKEMWDNCLTEREQNIKEELEKIATNAVLVEVFDNMGIACIQVEEVKYGDHYVDTGNIYFNCYDKLTKEEYDFANNVIEQIHINEFNNDIDRIFKEIEDADCSGIKEVWIGDNDIQVNQGCDHNGELIEPIVLEENVYSATKTKLIEKLEENNYQVEVND